jgi:excisionase family DNA binding protein
MTEPYRPRRATQQQPRTQREEILTTEDVAALLKVPVQTVYKWTQEGTGPPFYKIGKHNRYKLGEVMDWFDAHRDEVSSGR